MPRSRAGVETLPRFVHVPAAAVGETGGHLRVKSLFE
jgi:hypothetical protein